MSSNKRQKKNQAQDNFYKNKSDNKNNVIPSDDYYNSKELESTNTIIGDNERKTKFINENRPKNFFNSKMVCYKK